MKVLIAPDAFKGSISATDISMAVENGVLRVFPEAKTIKVPLADGGEGTVENLVFASNGLIHYVQVKNPVGQDIIASYGVLGDKKTVIIEMAQASGLPLLKESKRNPLYTTSFGTGQLIKDALDKGYRKFLVGLGGSATNDGGTGMLTALGVKFYDKKGNELLEGGGYLSELAYFDGTNLDSRLHASTFSIASDVNNRLCGPLGASAVFGPQKGATPEMVQQLDQALKQLAYIVKKQKGIDILDLEGGGAAGGMGAALLAFLDAEMNSGIDIIMKKLCFEEMVRTTDLIITGEGKLDSQTLSGKVISGVCKAARKHGIPVVALCGGMEIKPFQFDELGILSAFSIAPSPCSLERSMEFSSLWIVERTESIMRLIKHFYEGRGTD